jgi:hypothetical protein
MAEIAIRVEPTRLEPGGWIQHISVTFPAGERSLNLATAYREGSAKRQSAELQALLVRLAEANQDEGRRESKEKPDGFVVLPPHSAQGYRAIGANCTREDERTTQACRAFMMLWLSALFLAVALLFIAIVIAYLLVSTYLQGGRRR